MRAFNEAASRLARRNIPQETPVDPWITISYSLGFHTQSNDRFQIWRKPCWYHLAHEGVTSCFPPSQQDRQGIQCKKCQTLHHKSATIHGTGSTINYIFGDALEGNSEMICSQHHERSRRKTPPCITFGNLKFLRSKNLHSRKPLAIGISSELHHDTTLGTVAATVTEDNETSTTHNSAALCFATR